jgi:hypothetical protein
VPLGDLTRVEGRDQVDGEIVWRPAVNAVRDSERKVVRAWDEEGFHDVFHDADPNRAERLGRSIDNGFWQVRVLVAIVES